MKTFVVKDFSLSNRKYSEKSHRIDIFGAKKMPPKKFRGHFGFSVRNVNVRRILR